MRNQRPQQDDDRNCTGHEQINKLDGDYQEWRNERRKKLAEEFEKWRIERNSRQASMSGTETETKPEKEAG